MRAMKAMSITATLKASCPPSKAPRAAASSTLASWLGMSTFTSPEVSGCSVSGSSSLAIITAPGAVMITAVSRWTMSTWATCT